MPRSIEDIIRNAINTGDFTPSAGAGILSSEQARKFIQQTFEATTLGGQYRHLQMLYSLHPDGEITCKINPKAITRERRKLKAYKRLVDDGRMEYREVENNFKSWICANYKFMSRQQIRNMTALFRELFGKDITWKKKSGHGRLRWLMGQKSKA